MAYLKPALNRLNLRIETDAHATGLILEGRRVLGVRYIQGGEIRDVVANREVILSLAPVQSPQLLQLSGIGPGDLQSAMVSIWCMNFPRRRKPAGPSSAQIDVPGPATNHDE